jgi:hypothetical protein
MTQRLSYMDPERAALASRGGGPEGSLGYLALGSQAATRSRAGQQDEALRLVDQALAEFERDPALPNPTDLMMFLQSLGQVDTGRAVRVFGTLARSEAVEAGSYQGIPITLPSVLRSGETSVALTPAEAVALTTLHSLRMWPELSVRGLAAFPGLKAKVDALGGLDAFLGASPMGGPRAPKMELVHETASVNESAGSWRDGLRLYTELGGKTSPRDLDAVEALLADKEPRALVALAQRANWENPDLASLALRKATERVFRVEPLEKRVEVVVLLVSATRMIEGDIDADLIARALKAVEELRDEGRAEPDASTDPGARFRQQLGMTSVDLSEAVLLGHYARVDFETAMLHVRRLPEGRRLGVLVQIASFLGMY